MFGEVISVTIIGLLVKQVKRITVKRLSLPSFNKNKKMEVQKK